MRAVSGIVLFGRLRDTKLIYEPNYAGSVDFHRKMKLNPVFKNPYLFQLWSWCLLSASYKHQVVSIDVGGKKQEIEIKPGQIIYGRLSTANELGMNPNTTRTRLKKLESMGLIKIFPKCSYSIVYINKWHIYQPKIDKKTKDNTNENPEISELDSCEFNGEVIFFKREKIK